MAKVPAKGTTKTALKRQPPKGKALIVSRKAPRQPTRKSRATGTPAKNRRCAHTALPAALVGTARLPRDIMAMIYLYVKAEDDARAQAKDIATDPLYMSVQAIVRGRQPPKHRNSSALAGDTCANFPALALIDRWSYEFVIRQLYHAFTIDGRPNSLGRLIQINTEDRGHGVASHNSTSKARNALSATWEDTSVVPYLRRYQQLRRVTSITIASPGPRGSYALPSADKIKYFLDHIGEPGPLYRNIHLVISGDVRFTRRGGRNLMRSLGMLIQPISVSIMVNEEADFETAHALAKIWPSIAIHVTMPGPLRTFHAGLKSSPGTWLHYIVDDGHDDDGQQVEPTRMTATTRNALFNTIKRMIIDRSRHSDVQIDISLPAYDPKDLAVIMQRLVDTETQLAMACHVTSRLVDAPYVPGQSRATWMRGLRLFEHGEQWSK